MNRLFASLLASLALASAVPAVAQETADAAATPAATTPAANFPLSANFNIEEDRENILLLDLSTGRRVAIRLVPQWAPGHVARIKELARSGFYNGVIFHRVIDGFMAQTGDPTGTGQGQSELPDLTAEFNQMPHVRGSVSMARLGNDENSANSQFFIVFYPRFALDRNYTNFGRVIAGMDAVDAIERGEPPSNPTVILQASIAADNIPQMMPTAPEPVAAPQIITGEMLRGAAAN
jgi:cyclophilin family peptidyl-prolyl cis-trans isomerase